MKPKHLFEKTTADYKLRYNTYITLCKQNKINIVEAEQYLKDNGFELEWIGKSFTRKQIIGIKLRQ